jgi:hypothetical protein
MIYCSDENYVVGTGIMFADSSRTMLVLHEGRITGSLHEDLCTL